MLPEATRCAAFKRILSHPNEAQPMFPAAKREAATVKSPSSMRMVNSVHVRVKRVLPLAKLHYRDAEAG